MFIVSVGFYVFYVLNPMVVSADAATISSGVNTGGSGIYDVIKGCVPTIAIVSAVCAVIVGFFDHSPQTIQKIKMALLCILGVCAFIWFAPTVFEWFFSLLNNAGGGEWKTLS